MKDPRMPIANDQQDNAGLGNPDVSRISAASGPTVPLRPTRSPSHLGRLLETRRSSREFHRLPAADLHQLVIRTVRPSGVSPTPRGYVERFKPYPSAGARHPHTLLLLVNDVDGLHPGLWMVDEVSLSLVRIDEPSAFNSLNEAIHLALRAPAPPPAAIVTMGRWRRTIAKYPGQWGDSLVWRDAGVLLGTMHLIAHEMGLASTIVGIGETVKLGLKDCQDSLTDTGALAVGASR